MKKKLSEQAIERLRGSITPTKPVVEAPARLVMSADIDDGLIPLVEAALKELGDQRGAKSRLVNHALAYYLDATAPKASAAQLPMIDSNATRHEPLRNLVTA